MKCLATALGTLLLALAVTPSANAVVRPEWVVVRWAYGDCKIWHNERERPRGRRLEGRGIRRDLSGSLGEASRSVRHQGVRLTPARGIAAA